MGIFNIFKKPAKPDNAAAANAIYELLFCDNLELYKGNQQSNTYPWDILFSEADDDAALQRIINDNDMASRVKILAYRKLSPAAENANKKDLLGVIVEVGLDNGLDVLASFKDGTARYINQTGKMIIWETTNDVSNDLTNKLFSESYNVINQIGPWDQPRKPRPEKGMVRLSFLVSDEIYFGEGPINVFFNDQLAAPVLSSAAELMKYLVEKAS